MSDDTARLIETYFAAGTLPGLPRGHFIDGAFVAGELAIATYLQAKAFGKKLVALPAPIVSRFQHHTIAFDSRYGEIGPKDLNGTTFGIRAYSVTTGAWTRQALIEDYGLDCSKVNWVVDDEELEDVLEILSGEIGGHQRASGGLVDGANFHTGDFDPARIGSIVDELHALNAG